MRKINVDEIEFDWDPGDPEGFKAGLKRFGKRLGARATGVSIYELPPGQAICPYHYEYAEEEWLIVLEGTPTLRHAEGSEQLKPWDVAFFETGPSGAHGVRNETDETVRVLMASDLRYPAATVYPDSDKIGIWTGNPDDNVMAPRSANVPYSHNEPGTN
jgi:uncharacterized cupin superfamily protein